MNPSIMLLLMFFYSIFNAQIYYNVKDYGAIPNDGKDDWKAFQDCINTALKNVDKNPVVLVPNGIFDISNTLIFDYLDGSISIQGEGRKPVLKFSTPNSKNLIEARGFLLSPSKGVFSVKNIHIIGTNRPFSKYHPFINKNEWSAAVAVLDKREAHLDGVIIQNHYGQGVHISTTQQEGISENSRFQNVTILNSTIDNVWGHNPQHDNYGDAIYLSNVASALVQQNIIFNNTSITKQLGRAGIVIEYMSENIKLIGNKVLDGYDRPLHIEATYGGHIIKNNQFNGSDLGLVLAENITKKYKTTLFENNLITNKGLSKHSGLRKTYGYGNFGDRALAYIVTNGSNSVPSVKLINNNFVLKDEAEYESNSLINNRSSSVIFERNIFNVGRRNGIAVFNYGKAIFKNNKLFGNINVK